MYLLRHITSILLASANPDPSNLRLTMSYDLATEANELATKGMYQEASSIYDEAINLGRKPALEQGEPLALDWLISVYRNSVKAKLQVNDVGGARSQAWAACVFSQNKDLSSIQLMAEVCQASGDSIGEVQAIKQILELDGLDEGQINKQELEARLTSLEEELKTRFEAEL